jgi:hypothetical protein
MYHSEARTGPRNLLFSIILAIHRCRELASLDCEL